jgi:hypothetical protein
MNLINIKVVNACTGLSNAEALATLSAIQTQITRDFAPVWGVTANLIYMDYVLKYDSMHWYVILLNNSDQAGALGYHDLTPQGLPLGKIFVTTTQQNGGKWSVTASHEILEMLADPYIDTMIFNQLSNTAGRLFFYEVCDPVEDDSLGYDINGITVSDFVYPEWFEPGATAGTKLDFMGHATAPLTIVPNLGYYSYFDVTAGNGWNTNTTGKTNPHRSVSRLSTRGKFRKVRSRNV